jgi:hypothetical protein
VVLDRAPGTASGLRKRAGQAQGTRVFTLDAALERGD